MTPRSPRARLIRQLVAVTSIRWVLNVAHRVVYPFLPAIARGLSVSLPAMGLLMTARSTVGIASPLFGPLSDRVGRRRMMAVGLLSLCAGAAVVASLPIYPAAFVGFLLMGVAKIVFDPSLQAYLGDRVDYRRRGLVIAFTELSWAGAILLGAPAVGAIIEGWGWRAPFGLMAVLAIAGVALLLLVLPGDRRTAEEARLLPSFARAFGVVLRRKGAVAALSVSFLLMAANEILFIVYGTWMETGFGLSVGRLGLATTVIGVAEMLGEIGVGGLTDRVGKRRAVAIGLALTALFYLAPALLSASLGSALLGLFLLFLCFEFTIVSIIPLATELAPAARGTMMALNVAAISLGRAVGAPLGTVLWSAGGLLWNGLAAAAVTLLALGVLLAYVREGDDA